VGEAGCLQWPVLMPQLEGAGYRSQEGEEPVLGAPLHRWERGG
jgi:hypothetical protein